MSRQVASTSSCETRRNKPIAFACCLLLDVCSGCAYLHAHSPPLIHRDLKSLNILVDENWRGKVADFGMTRFQEDGTMTQCGSPLWMAPEMIKNDPYDEVATSWLLLALIRNSWLCLFVESGCVQLRHLHVGALHSVRCLLALPNPSLTHHMAQQNPVPRAESEPEPPGGQSRARGSAAADSERRAAAVCAADAPLLAPGPVAATDLRRDPAHTRSTRTRIACKPAGCPCSFVRCVCGARRDSRRIRPW